MTPETQHDMVHIVDGVAALAMVGSLVSILPPIAALFTIIWTAMRVYEMLTGLPFSQTRLAKWMTGRA